MIFFSFTDSGSLGIGTTNPNRLFSVVSGLAGQGIELKSPDPALWLIDNTSANKAWSIYNQGSSNGLAFRSENDDGSMRNTRLFLNHSIGNIGIATTTPQAKLHIIGAAKVSNLDGSYIPPVGDTELVTKSMLMIALLLFLVLVIGS